MAHGKDIASADGLGGLHKVGEPRQAVPIYSPGQGDNVVVARGARAAESRLVADPDQIARVTHTTPAPIDEGTKAHAPASEEGGARTPAAPHQDAHTTPVAASAWEASPRGEIKT